MNCIDVGNVIFSLRKEKKLTQKELADLMNISDKTVSKWERGIGCPDVSLLRELSEILNVNIEKLLIGDINQNERNGGNMKKIKFYVCPECGNISTATGEAEVSCCARKLEKLQAQKADENHFLKVEKIDDEYYITFNHEMSKEHYISFVAYVTCERAYIIKLYPEQSCELRMPVMRGGTFYFYCNKHKLFKA